MPGWIDIENPVAPMRGWRADPVGVPRGAVVVLQEIFGVNAHIREVTDRFAAAGFVALAPALFDPVQPGVELEYDQGGVDEGRGLTASLGFDRAVELIRAAALVLQSEGLRTGAVGFCWGGTLALLANTRLGLPAASYYGGRSVPFLGERLRAPMLFHFGEHDPIIPPEHVAAHREAHPGATVHVYPAGHGFNCGQRADFDPASAGLAWQRTIDFLEESLQ
ncbi:MAG: dienelactone hydrolase family protein [Lysobacter sp.]|nr:dienelactone hydrolase family protein [Lysobacter sp.]MDQ3268937.1 dienelactone hydrolase family protein [Pseudomonadota bacterium]